MKSSKSPKSVEVIRGIVVTLNRNGNKIVAIETPLHIYELNNDIMKFPVEEDDKLLGTVTDHSFNICYDVTLVNNKKVFGYFSQSNEYAGLSFQAIKGFDKFSYNSYNPLYSLDEEIKISLRQIANMQIDLNKMFKSEFL